MCGIAGLFHAETPKPVDPVRIERMCDAMVHRGPDGAGIWTEHGIGLGHRRLSVIDVEGSPQPMHSADGRAVIVFNGEIYNFRELRRELEKDGVRFRTQGDTEMILAAWQRWGTGCLEKLHGMFAFALYDLDKRQLLLARDRFGVKPMFMARLSDGSIAFASELKGLLAHPQLRRKVDPAALEAYMTWGYVPDTHSILSGVEKLPAGHFMLLEQGKAPEGSKQWWDIDFTKRASGSEADLSAELVHLMRDAVQSRMVADVPLGAFLSGGVDSSSVVALMSEASEEPVRTCSIGFDVAGLDETSYAKQIAQKFSTDHTARTVGQNDFNAIDQLSGMFDEPFADASALPTWHVCVLAREKVTVALSGDGADEAFAGYRRQVFHHNEERVRSILPKGFRQTVFGGLGKYWPKADWAPRPLRAKSTLLALAGSGDEGYASGLSVTTPEQRHALYSDRFTKLIGGHRAEDELVALMREAPGQSGLDRAQYADLKFWLPGDILTKVDRTSMAVSLEAREPLLDHRLVEFAAKLPEKMRVKGSTGKYLLKKCMERYLPDEILYRPKQGFVTPIAEWFRGPLAGEARNIADSSLLAETGWFSPQGLSDLADAHIAGRNDNSRVLWQLLMLEKSLNRLEITA
ncbi:XrtA/PEP-CTERM system amidotransferase [Erythrobacter sp. F6033]|uniref:XrtA/PEP-CTERM system amidotransferase n=1 Tax=Erythrobacter sp. F6033 TaxID=2926401 RepID=UPI001FF469D4|nr:XrtA/PEP-CTERM system amidotransferase [Erythrobacter sp. F6033]MCK0128255.1 amidotransferase 1, exosortase A system-associated [Erythrobacter sp. F6033]